MNIKDYLKMLPVRFHDEFMNEVVVDKKDTKGLRKAFEYYLEDILDELTQEEKDNIFVTIG